MVEDLQALAEKVDGTLTIVPKTNGLQITIFMPFTEKPKKRIDKKSIVKYTGEDIQFAEALYQGIVSNNGAIKVTYNQDKWADEFRLLRTKYSDDDKFIVQVIWHIYGADSRDTFWRSRILSAAKFREKFETVAAQMKGDKPKGYIKF